MMQSPISDIGSEIVRAAVTLARVEGIGELKMLEAKLNQQYPDHPDEVKAALTFWIRNPPSGG